MWFEPLAYNYRMNMTITNGALFQQYGHAWNYCFGRDELCSSRYLVRMFRSLIILLLDRALIVGVGLDQNKRRQRCDRGKDNLEVRVGRKIMAWRER